MSIPNKGQTDGIRASSNDDPIPTPDGEYEFKIFLPEQKVSKSNKRMLLVREIPPLEKAAKRANVPVLWLLVRPCLWQEFDFLSKTQSAVPLDRCFASLDPWQQDQILSDLCLKVKSSAWGIQIQLEPAPREAGWLLKLKGTVNYSAPSGAENENLGLLPFLAKNSLAIVPFVLTTSDGWWSQAPVEPDVNGAFEARVHLGLENRGVGNSYTIQVCVVQRISLPVHANWNIPATVRGSDAQICTRTR
jgi:hypothetical protein